jgi:glycerophosphoryl diester phosphodiesterase
MTKELIDDFHAHGVRVYPWTVDTKEDMDGSSAWAPTEF